MKELEFQVSSGNIFADMELEEADQLYVCAQLGFQIRQLLRERGYTHQQVTELLNITQQEADNLIKGQYHLFTEGKLIKFLNKLDFKVVIQISPHQDNEPFQLVALERS
ncbi:XRE family transcriptional regulator [Thalassoporum mexicanum PCC 7367]|uniref:helix-turn-helix domain-containing protein n=1 Tax=Thalassoporum mexicanum TaxID=3457544 RepID=UPI00029F89AD|nr:XRE family transcriptional regulator [Pseudanabaena sp. PCC 7367]AFY71641.1 XRE family transcriptional regulator [Pseudanabaena sp. PCC 7367]